MDVKEILTVLRAERDHLDAAIAALERATALRPGLAKDVASPRKEKRPAQRTKSAGAGDMRGTS